MSDEAIIRQEIIKNSNENDKMIIEFVDNVFSALTKRLNAIEKKLEENSD